MRDDYWLKRVAAQVYELLRIQKAGTGLRVRPVRRVDESDTGGWMISVGTLGPSAKGIWLDLWLDRYANPNRRTFYAGFYSAEAKDVKRLVRASRKQWPVVLTIKDADTMENRYTHLIRPLPAGKFNAPVVEHYREDEDNHYFGFYERMKGRPEQVETRFCQQAVDFFLDVIRALPESADDGGHSEVYPQIENRTVVRSHLTRERSRFLASQCKQRDNYKCQVCGTLFENHYGLLGRGFAEAHHKHALHMLREGIKTRLEDLITVCANCHRMLHKMEGKPEDITKLKAIVRKHCS